MHTAPQRQPARGGGDGGHGTSPKWGTKRDGAAHSSVRRRAARAAFRRWTNEKPIRCGGEGLRRVAAHAGQRTQPRLARPARRVPERP
ncbi:hypothetical protein AZ78_4011 [Lysobacter capsici AZ78]|uniref:Uncharacterized protein n=1 Tax=Lysobacter capsici AZ78 TaxID=1444315 RepID=A0A120AHP1_9GAMM|nr:hypothetical protein AZ78_4011 [Lysobacter capsici AZ78]